jgi:hypothetical protein
MHAESHTADAAPLLERTISVLFNVAAADAPTRRMVFAMCERAREALKGSCLSPEMQALGTLNPDAFAQAIHSVMQSDSHMFRYMLPEQMVWYCLDTAARARCILRE